MDSVLNYPLYDAIVQGFSIPGPRNMSNVSAVMGQIQNSFKVCCIHLATAVTNSSRQDPTTLGNFMENQDVPRWHSISVDPQSLMCVPLLFIRFIHS